MALLMVLTVCLLVYAALEYRIRQALQANNATFPNQKGQRVQHPTARQNAPPSDPWSVTIENTDSDPFANNIYPEHTPFTEYSYNLSNALVPVAGALGTGFAGVVDRHIVACRVRQDMSDGAVVIAEM